MQKRDGVLIVGSVNIDLTVFAARRPQPGETFVGDEFNIALGGKGANQAIAAARALELSAGRAYFVGCIGSDMFAEQALNELAAADVDTTYLKQLSGKTGVAHIRVDAAGENDIVIVPEANAQLSGTQISEAVAALAPKCGVLLTQLETPLALTTALVTQAAEHGMQVILDPAPAAKLPPEIWPHVTVATPNETEAQLLTGIPVTDVASATKAGNWFLERGVTYALITLAGAGALLVSKDRVETYKPFTVTVVDTTAAGDAFAGHLAAALASGDELPAAIRTAAAAGALAVTQKGASPSLPTASAVQEFLAANAE